MRSNLFPKAILVICLVVASLAGSGVAEAHHDPIRFKRVTYTNPDPNCITDTGTRPDYDIENRDPTWGPEYRWDPAGPQPCEQALYNGGTNTYGSMGWGTNGGQACGTAANPLTIAYSNQPLDYTYGSLLKTNLPESADEPIGDFGGDFWNPATPTVSASMYAVDPSTSRKTSWFEDADAEVAVEGRKVNGNFSATGNTYGWWFDDTETLWTRQEVQESTLVLKPGDHVLAIAKFAGTKTNAGATGPGAWNIGKCYIRVTSDSGWTTRTAAAATEASTNRTAFYDWCVNKNKAADLTVIPSGSCTTEANTYESRVTEWISCAGLVTAKPARPFAFTYKFDPTSAPYPIEVEEQDRVCGQDPRNVQATSSCDTDLPTGTEDTPDDGSSDAAQDYYDHSTDNNGNGYFDWSATKSNGTANTEYNESEGGTGEDLPGVTANKKLFFGLGTTGDGPSSGCARMIQAHTSSTQFNQAPGALQPHPARYRLPSAATRRTLVRIARAYWRAPKTPGGPPRGNSPQCSGAPTGKRKLKSIHFTQKAPSGGFNWVGWTVASKCRVNIWRYPWQDPSTLPAGALAFFGTAADSANWMPAGQAHQDCLNSFGVTFVCVTGGASGWMRDLCTTVVHEVGHLYGMKHSGDANSIMYSSEAPNQRNFVAERHLQGYPKVCLQRFHTTF